MCLAAVKGGFCQLGHGREAPVRRLAVGDRILYYSPRERMHQGAVLQAFTAAGEVLEGEVYRVETKTGFRLYRRNVSYLNLATPRSDHCCRLCHSPETVLRGGRLSDAPALRSHRLITIL
jgi:EVE domain